MPLFKFLFSLFIIVFIGINNVFAALTAADKRFLQKYYDIYQDPFAYLQKQNINIEDDSIRLSELTLIKPKPTGASEGGVYSDNKNIYFVKKCNAFHEMVGSKMVNTILGTKCSPIVKVVKDKPRTIASLALPNFQMHKDIDLSLYKKIKGEAELTIVLDYLGIVDRHSRNMGYVVQKKSKTLIAARVDFDASYDFESNVTGSKGYTTKTNHLDLKHLYISMQTYPRKQVKDIIKKIVNVPDEQIITIVLQSWAVLSQTPHPRSLETAVIVTRKLIERKKALKQLLKKRYSKNEYEQLADLFN